MVKEIIKKIRWLTQRLFERFGYRIIPFSKELSKDIDEGFKKIYEDCKDYTITSADRMYALYKAVEYVVGAGIPGDLVECGVLRGGNPMIMAYTLLKEKRMDRNIYLYDTFAGASEPTEKDIKTLSGRPAKKTWEKCQKESFNEWMYAPIEEVKKNVLSVSYPSEKIFFVKGMVEKTIPSIMPSKISILRLDTDFYESTYHELKHLFPLLSKGGVLIIDDYGDFTGAKRAVDKYLKENNIKILLNILDGTARIGIKI